MGPSRSRVLTQKFRQTEFVTKGKPPRHIELDKTKSGEMWTKKSDEFHENGELNSQMVFKHGTKIGYYEKRVKKRIETDS